jgi:hypothetical protein
VFRQLPPLTPDLFANIKREAYCKKAAKLRMDYRRSSDVYKKTKYWAKHQEDMKEYRKKKRAFQRKEAGLPVRKKKKKKKANEKFRKAVELVVGSKKKKASKKRVSKKKGSKKKGSKKKKTSNKKSPKKKSLKKKTAKKKASKRKKTASNKIGREEGA